MVKFILIFTVLGLINFSATLHNTHKEKKNFKNLSSNSSTKSWDCLARKNEIKSQTHSTKTSNSITCKNCDDKFQARATRVLIHGWKIVDELLPKSMTEDFEVIEKFYKKYHNEKFNLVIVEWSAESIFYSDARKYIKKVAKEVATYLDEKLGKDEKLWKQLKVIGHSLGAHMAGFIGKKVQNGKVGTIIGLDPASPGYEERPEVKRLEKNDATYTECIHTNTDCYGIEEPICQANFYPNSGYDQPGCYGDICDHLRAYQLFAESIEAENKFTSEKCFPVDDDYFGDCTDERTNMGGEPGNIDKKVEGFFWLSTEDDYPYSEG